MKPSVVKDEPRTFVFLVEIKRGSTMRYNNVFATRQAAGEYVAQQMTESVCEIKATIKKMEVRS